MAFHTSQLLAVTLVTVIHVTAGNHINNTNVENGACNPAELQQFYTEHCENLVNYTVIINEKDFNVVFPLCTEIMGKYYQVLGKKEITCTDRPTQECRLNVVLTLLACEQLFVNNLPQEVKTAIKNKEKLPDFGTKLKPLYTTLHVVLGIVVIVGIAANILLAVIFIRHKKARNDMMLINLTVTDMLSLVINFPILITAHTMTNRLAAVMSSILLCGSHFCIFVSVYSLVIISFLRFRAVFSKVEIRKDKGIPNWIKLTCLWGLGALYGISFYLSDELSLNLSIIVQRKIAATRIYVAFVIDCILPLVLIAIFSLLTSIQLRKLAESIPGEKSQHVKRIQDRYLAAKALIGLVVLSFISYAPYKISLIVYVNYYPDLESEFKKTFEDLYMWRTIDIFAYGAIFLNSALSPVLLYFLSSKFRNYFKSYLTCKTKDLE